MPATAQVPSHGMVQSEGCPIAYVRTWDYDSTTDADNPKGVVEKWGIIKAYEAWRCHEEHARQRNLATRQGATSRRPQQGVSEREEIGQVVDPVSMEEIQRIHSVDCHVFLTGGGLTLRTVKRAEVYNGPWAEERKDQPPPQIWTWARRRNPGQEKGEEVQKCTSTTDDGGLEAPRMDPFNPDF